MLSCYHLLDLPYSTVHQLPVRDELWTTATIPGLPELLQRGPNRLPETVGERWSTPFVDVTETTYLNLDTEKLEIRQSNNQTISRKQNFLDP